MYSPLHTFTIPMMHSAKMPRAKIQKIVDITMNRPNEMNMKIEFKIPQTIPYPTENRNSTSP